MSTPQLTASSEREASCSPFSVYDEVPSPRADAISYPIIAGATTGFYAAPADDSKYIQPNTNCAAYADVSSQDYLQGHWGYQGAVLPEPAFAFDDPAAWHFPNSDPAQNGGRPLTCAGLPSNWTLEPSRDYFQEVPVDYAAPSFSTPSQPLAQLITPAAIPELQHPRPQRLYVPPWQTAVGFSADEFLTGASQRHGSSLQSISGFQDSDEISEEDEDYSGSEYGDDMDMDEDWEDGFEEDQGAVENGTDVLSFASTTDIDAGQGIGLGSSTRLLGSDSILYRSVATPLRCPDSPDFSWPSFIADSCEFSTITPSFA